MDKWLVKRLTKERKESPVWYELADVLEEFWDTYFAPEADRLADAKSLFTASEEDINRRLAELGDFFDVHLPLADSSKPLALAWRKIEVHDKDAASIIDSILDRNFPELHARWEVMYCPLDAEYRYENLYSQTEIEISRGALDQDLDNYMMTSRGRLWIDYRQMQVVYPHLTKEEFLAVVRSEISKVKPTHIVYDGELFLLYIDWFHDCLSYETRDKLTTLDLCFDHDQHKSEYERFFSRDLPVMEHGHRDLRHDNHLHRDAFAHNYRPHEHEQTEVLTRDIQQDHRQYATEHDRALSADLASAPHSPLDVDYDARVDRRSDSDYARHDHNHEHSITRDAWGTYVYLHDTEHDRIVARKVTLKHRATGRYREFVGFDEVPADYSPTDLHYKGDLI